MAEIVRASLDRPEYKRLWESARRRLEANGLALDGSPITLKDLTREEADAVAGLLGVRRPTDGSVRVPLAALDASLRRSVVGRGLIDVLSALGGPLVDRRALKERRESDRAQHWEELGRHHAVVDEPTLSSWLDLLRSSGLARRLAGSDERLAVSAALDVLAALPRRSRDHRLAVLAADVTGDAHGLDRGKAAGTLTVHALSWLAGRPFPQDAADWRRTWSEAGVACDDLSCDVLVLNLPGWPAEPLRLTLRQASAWTPPAAAAPAAAAKIVFASENPAVLAAASDHLGDRCPTMVCLDGMPSTAALVVLDGLASAGYAVRYHGDFDWRGLSIASVLVRKVPVAEPWRFGCADYRHAVARGLGSVALAGKPTLSPWDPQLLPVMQQAGVAVYEEQVVDLLLDDLTVGAGP